MRRAARLRRPSARLMDIKLYRTGDQQLNEARPDQGCTGTHCCRPAMVRTVVMAGD